MEKPRVVSVKEIAQFFGVSLPTVSNWMKRYPDFPAGRKVDGSKRERFVLREVEEWHSIRGLKSPTDQANRTIRRYAPEEHLKLLATLFVCLNECADTQEPSREALLDLFNGLSAHIRDNLISFDLNTTGDELQILLRQYGKLRGQDLAEELLRERERSVRGVHSGSHATPVVLAQFMASLMPQGAQRILDMASGDGSILRAIAERDGSVDLRGVEGDEETLIFSSQLAKLFGHKIQFEPGDSLHPSADADSYDMVVADPPLLKMSIDSGEPLVLPGWPVLRSSESEFAFMARAVENVTTDGIAAVLTSNRTSSTRSGTEFRRELLLRGSLRAVVSLPARLRPNTAIPHTLWILAAPNSSTDHVLMVDASKLDAAELAEGGRVLDAVRGGLDPRREPAGGLAARVPLRELLTRDVNLRPEPWVAKAAIEQDPESALEAARKSWTRLEELGGQSPLEDPEFKILKPRAPILRIQDLISVGDIAVFSGLTGIRGSAESDGFPVLSRPILFGIEDPNAARRKLGGDQSGAEILPDDIVVAAGAGGIIAKVWKESGWVAGSGLTVIRVCNDSFDPEFLALALMHPRNQAQVDSARPGGLLNVKSLEIPMLPLDAQLPIGRLAVWTHAAERTLIDQLQEFSDLKRELSDLLGAGQIEI